MRKHLLIALTASFFVAISAQAVAALDPTPAKLTIRLSGGGKTGQNFEEMTYLVKVSGVGWAKGQSAELVDATGEHTVTVKGLNPQTDCSGADELRTGTGTSDWCIQLTNVEGGHEYTGTITPEGAELERTALTLTVTARDGFVGLPLLIVVIAGALGVWWALWVGSRLGRTVSKNLLLDAVGRNQGPDGTPMVTRLTNWLDEARHLPKAKTDDELRKIVLTAIEVEGPKRRAEKAALNQVVTAFVGKHAGWGEAPLIEEARKIAASETSMYDIYSVAGDKQDANPTKDVTSKVERAEALLARIESARGEITKSPNPESRKQELRAQADAIEAQLRYSTVTVDDLNNVSERILQLLGDIYPSDAESFRADARKELAFVPEDSVVLKEMIPAARARTAIVLTVIGFAVIAMITAASGTYGPNQTFGSGRDYLALAVAAFGSASVAGIVTAVGLGAIERSKG
jgi:hypothetical protein